MLPAPNTTCNSILCIIYFSAMFFRGSCRFLIRLVRHCLLLISACAAIGNTRANSVWPGFNEDVLRLNDECKLRVRAFVINVDIKIARYFCFFFFLSLCSSSTVPRCMYTRMYCRPQVFDHVLQWYKFYVKDSQLMIKTI